MKQYERWVCLQCFISIRKDIKAYKDKPPNNCPDHWRYEHVKIQIQNDNEDEIKIID